jgi:glycosyltransferase involved in cell wall biosynthesis
MKIVHVMDWYIPNMGYQENFLPAEQKKLGFDVEIITSDRFPPYEGYSKNVGKIQGKRIIDPGVFFENNVKIHRLKTIIEIKNGGILVLAGLKKKLKELKPDIVQAHNATCFSTLLVILYCKKMGYKVFVDEHAHSDNFRITSFSKKMMMDFLIIFYHRYGSRVRCFMPVTYDSKYILESLFQIPSEKIQILHLGINNQIFIRSDLLKNKGREKLQINDDCTLLITAGKFNKSKDIELLIETYADVVKIFSKTKLLLLGGGDDQYMQKIRNLVDSANLKDHVIFHDFVKNSELPAYYNAADIGVWPGSHSITSVESIATGLPIIVPENSLAYKVLLENGAAVGFKRGDTASLRNRMCYLLTDQNSRQKIRENCLKTAAEILSWEKVANFSIKIYQNDIVTNPGVR